MKLAKELIVRPSKAAKFKHRDPDVTLETMDPRFSRPAFDPAKLMVT